MADRTKNSSSQPLPPGQQLAGEGKWPLVGERGPRDDDSPWTLSIEGAVRHPRRYTLDELCERQQIEREIDLHCVTRWSKLGVPFVGIRLAELLQEAKVRPEAGFVSFVARSARNHSTSLALPELLKLDPIVALQALGAPLTVEHGGPIRMVVPGRYFYKSVKWLEKIRLLEEDELGYWEAETGYHNHADPWKEERFMAPTITKRQAAELIARRDFRGMDLRGMDASGRDLSELNAQGALLRDTWFLKSVLVEANFSQANLSNSHFQDAILHRANFQGADLEGANFAGADLREADLSGASLFGASFCDQQGESLVHGARLDESTRIDSASVQQLTAAQQRYVTQCLRPKSP